jgi:hypothetical protein
MWPAKKEIEKTRKRRIEIIRGKEEVEKKSKKIWSGGPWA